MEYSERIEHKGIVSEIIGNTVRVNFISRSACSECHAKGYCVESDMQERSIDVNDVTGLYHPGDPVNVIMKESLGYLAILLGFIFPSVVLIVVMVLVHSFTGNDLAAGISALVSMAPYYFVIWLFRKHIKKTFSFQLEKLSEPAHE